MTKDFILVGRAANVALVHMQRGAADGIAAMPFSTVLWEYFHAI